MAQDAHSRRTEAHRGTIMEREGMEGHPEVEASL